MVFPLSTTNPYGASKLMVEYILRDVAASDAAWSIGLLRYFNPVGAHESELMGEDPNGIPNNLMPFVSQVAVGLRERLSVFGDDYATVDLGTGRGYSVLEMVRAFDKASGKSVPYEIVARRPGHVAQCYADPSYAFEMLGWKAELGIERMCEDAWRWQSMNPKGFE